ncbi:PKD domain-containing protein [Brachybacterium sillae]|uniref:PKD domain-containing protein n=1 Tax=Brachybacterium sillae TaxID=2810536 RepID=UPI00217E5A8A|nr:PKD domain-containing protein [Brachybacterium sillae]
MITVTREDFARLPVEPLVPHAGPEAGWIPVNSPTVLYVEPTDQILDTTLLGTPVQVRAIPVSYTWSMGDGGTITTTKRGKPYPSEEVAYYYETEGWYDITLTTTFAGQFSVNGGPWQDIDGTITIDSTPVPLYSNSLESRLVNPDSTEPPEPIVPDRTPDTEGHPNPRAGHETR